MTASRQHRSQCSLLILAMDDNLKGFMFLIGTLISTGKQHYPSLIRVDHRARVYFLADNGGGKAEERSPAVVGPSERRF